MFNFVSISFLTLNSSFQVLYSAAMSSPRVRAFRDSQTAFTSVPEPLFLFERKYRQSLKIVLLWIFYINMFESFKVESYETASKSLTPFSLLYSSQDRYIPDTR